MIGEVCLRRKSNSFSSQIARRFTRWCCCAGDYKDCSGAHFSWLCAVRLGRAPRSLCAFRYKLDWNLLGGLPEIITADTGEATWIEFSRQLNTAIWKPASFLSHFPQSLPRCPCLLC